MKKDNDILETTYRKALDLKAQASKVRKTINKANVCLKEGLCPLCGESTIKVKYRSCFLHNEVAYKCTTCNFTKTISDNDD